MSGNLQKIITSTSSDDRIQSTVIRFIDWFNGYGEVSYDHQSYFASTVGRWAKGMYYKNKLLGIVVVAPMILSEAFAPSTRTLFWKRQRFPIADAHYAMGYALLARTYGKDEYYKKAVHFLEILEQTRSLGYDDFCWGYPFDWQTRGGTINSGTPLITTIPYVYEAFSEVYELDKKSTWLLTMRSIAEHALRCYQDIEVGPDTATCAYTPASDDKGGVVNASAYRAFLLTKAAVDFSEDRYRKVAQRNLNFVLSAQNADGSWFYSVDGQRDFVDHFHTCFVLKALAKIERLTGDSSCAAAIDRGIKYYAKYLFDEHGLPKPFSKAPRLTVYRRELYDYAECINLATLLSGRYKELDCRAASTLKDTLARWCKVDGSFRSRELHYGWDNVPMHRWAQSQMFRSLCFVLYENFRGVQAPVSNH